MSNPTPDVVDLLVGITPGSRLDAIRSHRPEARQNAQKSYLALFEPELPGNVTLTERFALATFVAGLHHQPAIADFYAAGLARQNPAPGLIDAIRAETASGLASGPFGSFPRGPLDAENTTGPVLAVAEASRPVLGRLAAGLEHAHMLVYHLRDASPQHLQRLLDAGWSTPDIVTLSQLVAFLSFQIRVVVGLKALAAAPSEDAIAPAPAPALAQ